MTIYDPDGNHIKYTAENYHFSPESERYTGADRLITAQRNGWRLISSVYKKHIEMRSGRYTYLYYFLLVKHKHKMVMPILATPFIEQMLVHLNMLVRPFPYNDTSDQTDRRETVSVRRT